jgi:hypothetical protein
MSYDEQQQRKSRVVVETPAARREVVETQVSRVPERRGLSGGAVAALVIGAVALVTILFLFLMNRQDEVNANVRVATAPTPVQQPVIVQQPAPAAPQQPVIIQQPAAPASAAPIIVTPPSTSTSSSSTTTTSAPSGTDDASVQISVDKKLSDDTTLGSSGILATVIDGKVTLTGTVNSEDLKTRAERLVKAVKGVKRVDNQITVSGTE